MLNRRKLGAAVWMRGQASLRGLFTVGRNPAHDDLKLRRHRRAKTRRSMLNRRKLGAAVWMRGQASLRGLFTVGRNPAHDDLVLMAAISGPSGFDVFRPFLRLERASATSRKQRHLLQP